MGERVGVGGGGGDVREVDDDVVGEGYRQGTLWLSPEELAEMVDELRAVFAARTGNGPAPNRRPHLVSAIFFPSGAAPDDQPPA
ncbi:hypothetical protein LX83_006567 [Goodfellowiella coeruleoviolacea]|uniref:Uncharacterized protein n=1 Tax=Goodfellowiella coeruleoviolacea TaxID=334858 RepID=A0AAE3GK14_9PSEU|nr:hypothetical protein [Goodfellowiella coeruleoviolacea]